MPLNNTVIVVKTPQEVKAPSVSIAADLQTGETISSVALGTISPASPALTVNTLTNTTNSFSARVASGSDGLSYGVPFNVTTSLARVLTYTMAVLVQTNISEPYAARNPDDFQTLIEQLEAGEAAVGRSSFSLPADYDLNTAYVLWSLMDREGQVYANGNAFEIVTSNTGLSLNILSRAVINAPSTIPATVDGTSYQLRWELRFGDGRSSSFSFENIKIVGLTSNPLGAEDTVEMFGEKARVSLVVKQPYDTVGYEVYLYNNKLVDLTLIQSPKNIADGWLYSAYIDTNSATPGANILNTTLDPYQVLWRMLNTSKPSDVTRESSSLFVINAAIIAALKDMRAQVSKAWTTLYGTPDHIFSDATLMTWMRRGRDMFNSAGAMPTDFDMTNATGPVREFWLNYAELAALRAQYLAEGEKAFSFSGQAISLEVDRTQFYSQAASDIEKRLDQEVKPFKINLSKRGLTSGDGNVNGLTLAVGATAQVGVSLNPATNFGRFYPLFSLRR